ncbi:alpha/beta hydrolase family protein [Nocardia terpenica]|uniref:Alpha/beta hydrolase n=1 Tax=Nocardia terpenica TaxID=455432 RepID=A0A291RG31_9NOCA|nr:CocE/NonD family hydrolase [Nocardia terpenica]ATL66259.1 alpha/beta hydrolase [Nocardia terpenica]
MTAAAVRPPRIPVEVVAACGYFLPRLMFLNSRIAPQIHWGDVTSALDGFPLDDLDLASAGFWREWARRWESVAQTYIGAAAASTTTAGRTAALRSAAACYHWAEFMYFDDPERKHALRQSIRSCFRRSLAGSPTPLIEQVARLADGTAVPVWIALPPNASAPVPCVLVSNGLDSVTEVEPLALAETYLERGLAVILFEGPGQGLALGRTQLRIDMEEIVSAVVDLARAHPAVDADRLGFAGISFGGYFALRVAQHLPGTFACVLNFSGGPRVAPFPGLPRRLKDDFRFAFMRPPGADLTGLLADSALDITWVPDTRVLSVHGALDDIFPVADIRRLDEQWAGRHHSLVYESEAHVCLNRLAQAAHRAADWVHSCLTTDRGLA